MRAATAILVTVVGAECGFYLMWSVVCIVNDNQVRYTLIKGEVPEADFTGTRRECLAYIRRMSGE
jgi:hypothetical protein